MNTEPFEVPASSAENFFTDESRLRGRAERLFLPRTETELASVLRMASETKTPVTVSCGRTGITGGAVPMGGWLVSFERMKKITGLNFDHKKNEFRLRCQPGVLLKDIQSALENKSFEGSDLWEKTDLADLKILQDGADYVFPPDPTETTAGLGGMVACNASGARTLYYGPTRDYVSCLRMLLMDGDTLNLERGKFHAAANGEFELKTSGGKIKRGRIPGYSMPLIKNAAGYYAKPGMDLVDLFIGSEGTLSVFSEIEIRLVQAPKSILGAICFFPSEKDAVMFVRAARGTNTTESDSPSLSFLPMAIEFFDARSLNMLREQRKTDGADSDIPELPEEAHTAVYIELTTGDDENIDVEDLAESLNGLLESCGSCSETAWAAFTSKEHTRLKMFRHALPEAINQRIAARTADYDGLTKLGSDFAVPEERLEDMLEAYHFTLDRAGFEYVVFGHIGNNHLHVNILPRDMAEYERGKSVYMELIKQIVSWGRTISGEHGIGKLKKPFLPLMFNETAIAEMKAVKNVFDPYCLLNRGNLF